MLNQTKKVLTLLRQLAPVLFLVGIVLAAGVTARAEDYTLCYERGNNDTFATAEPIPVSSLSLGNYRMWGDYTSAKDVEDKDFYTFKVTKATKIVIDIRGDGFFPYEEDFYAAVYDSEHATLAYTISFLGDEEPWTCVLDLAPGRYYIQVALQEEFSEYYLTVTDCNDTVKPPISLTSAIVTGLKDKTYTGSVILQDIDVAWEGAPLEEGRDYTLSYMNNKNAGTASVVISGKGKFTGSTTKTFKIKPKSITSATVTGIVAKDYTGSAVTQKPTVKVGGVVLQAGTDYTLSYKNNVNPGTATVTITGKGNYTGSLSRTFKIQGYSMSGCTVTGIKTVQFSLTPVAQNPVVKYDGKKLKKGTDYTLSYKNNTAVGTATVIITGKGGYTGSISRDYTIKPGSGVMTASTTKYSAYKGSSSVGRIAEGVTVSAYKKAGDRIKIKTSGVYVWVDARYFYDLLTGAPTSADRIGQGVTTKSAVVYTSPSKKSTKMVTLAKGTVRNLYAQSGNWYQIYTGGKYGWVRVDAFDYTKSVSRGRLDQVRTTKSVQTYYGPGTDYVKSIVIPAGSLVNIYKKDHGWSLVYRTGKYLWVYLTSSNSTKAV